MKLFNNISREFEYRITFSLSLIATQIIFILLFTFWPDFQDKALTFDDYSANEIELDMVEITRQQNQSPPPPPSPQVPVPRPEDYIVEDLPDLEFNDAINPDYRIHEMPVEEVDSYKVHGNPERPPSVTRIVEPIYPGEARRDTVKAEITVTFLVNGKGEVEEVSISEIRLYNEADDYEIVETIGYGLMEATMDAARKWRFRPARDNGENVRSISLHIFSYGI